MCLEVRTKASHAILISREVKRSTSEVVLRPDCRSRAYSSAELFALCTKPPTIDQSTIKFGTQPKSASVRRPRSAKEVREGCYKVAFGPLLPDSSDAVACDRSSSCRWRPELRPTFKSLSATLITGTSESQCLRSCSCHCCWHAATGQFGEVRQLVGPWLSSRAYK